MSTDVLNLCRNEWAFFREPNRAVLKLTGADAGGLLHRLSTNAVQQLSDGQGTLTVLVTEKGRIIDCVSVSVLGSDWYVVGSAEKSTEISRWIKKYTIMEDVRIRNLTPDCQPILVTGPHAMALLEHVAEREDVDNVSVGAALRLQDGSTAIRMPALLETAWLLLGDNESSVVQAIAQDNERDGTSVGEIVRISAGWGKSGHEWTNAFNPLEVGLVGWVDFTKGCYIGQEIIARLDSYDKVKHRLMGFTADSTRSGSILSEDKTIGIVTSCTPMPDDTYRGLALVRTAHAVANKTLQTEDGSLVLHMLPMEL